MIAIYILLVMTVLIWINFIVCVVRDYREKKRIIKRIRSTKRDVYIKEKYNEIN